MRTLREIAERGRNAREQGDYVRLAGCVAEARKAMDADATGAAGVDDARRYMGLLAAFFELKTAYREYDDLGALLREMQRLARRR